MSEERQSDHTCAPVSDTDLIIVTLIIKVTFLSRKSKYLTCLLYILRNSQ